MSVHTLKGLVFAIAWVFSQLLQAQPPSTEIGTWSIPAAGNSYQTASNGGPTTRGRGEIVRWSDPKAEYSMYFHLDRPAVIDIALEASCSEGSVPLTLSLGDQQRSVLVNERGMKPYEAGSFDIAQPGYVRVDFRRDKKDSDERILSLQGLVVRSSTQELQITYVATNEGNMFYWGRRGPSVHLSYPLPKGLNIEYAYSEITVAAGDDRIGSYFMANGFGEGYFGIQVNSTNERRVLFSVWSPFQTDNPRDIPEDQRVKLLARGPDVKTGEFGNEGSGGQSYLIYSWQSGRTYMFLTQVHPNDDGSSTYTSWFGDKEANAWRLIASFQRPKTQTYLRGFHSFLENFDPNTGHQSRRGQHGNIWVLDTQGQWHECLDARFSVDATGQGRHRLDFDGGADGNTFYLRNCGFFNGSLKPGEILRRASSKPTSPRIDLDRLPRE
jgi:hypothetical protein